MYPGRKEPLSDPAALRADLTTLKNNQVLLHPGQPPWPFSAILVAPVAAKIAPMAPWLKALVAFKPEGRWLLLGQRTRTVETKTLGKLQRKEACGLVFGLGKGGTPLPATWGELAAALDAAPMVPQFDTSF